MWSHGKSLSSWQHKQSSVYNQTAPKHKLYSLKIPKCHHLFRLFEVTLIQINSFSNVLYVNQLRILVMAVRDSMKMNPFRNPQIFFYKEGLGVFYYVEKAIISRRGALATGMMLLYDHIRWGISMTSGPITFLRLTVLSSPKQVSVFICCINYEILYRYLWCPEDST